MNVERTRKFSLVTLLLTNYVEQACTLSLLLLHGNGGAFRNDRIDVSCLVRTVRISPIDDKWRLGTIDDILANFVYFLSTTVDLNTYCHECHPLRLKIEKS